MKIGLYADGGYMCCCKECGEPFTGDKRALHCRDCATKQLQVEIEHLHTENKKIKSEANEIYRHVMWVAMEFGKVLQERADLQKELTALKPSKGG